LGEFRDRELIVALGKPVETLQLSGNDTFEHIRNYLSKWTGKAMNIITKEAFHGYYSKQMNEMETRVFVCNNIILNFHEMMSFMTS
jgi:hypothetical protein